MQNNKTKTEVKFSHRTQNEKKIGHYMWDTQYDIIFGFNNNNNKKGDFYMMYIPALHTG